MSGCSCGAPNRDGRVYCGRCGVAIASRCSCCGFVNELDCSFCGGCAAGLGAREANDGPPSATTEVRMLADDQLRELLRTQTLSDGPLAAPRRLTTQEEVDRLFGRSR